VTFVFCGKKLVIFPTNEKRPHRSKVAKVVPRHRKTLKSPSHAIPADWTFLHVRQNGRAIMRLTELGRLSPGRPELQINNVWTRQLETLMYGLSRRYKVHLIFHEGLYFKVPGPQDILRIRGDGPWSDGNGAIHDAQPASNEGSGGRRDVEHAQWKGTIHRWNARTKKRLFAKDC
jgi:hypothetical protein